MVQKLNGVSYNSSLTYFALSLFVDYIILIIYYRRIFEQNQFFPKKCYYKVTVK